MGSVPRRNCHPSLPWGPRRQGRHNTAALRAVWGENRALMSILIGSDSWSVSRLWGFLSTLFSFFFFALLISAQEGATILFQLVTVCVGVGKDDADRMSSYEKKAAFLIAFLDGLWVFLVNPTLWWSLPCRPCASLWLCRAQGSCLSSCCTGCQFYVTALSRNVLPFVSPFAAFLAWVCHYWSNGSINKTAADDRYRKCHCYFKPWETEEWGRNWLGT